MKFKCQFCKTRKFIRLFTTYDRMHGKRFWIARCAKCQLAVTYPKPSNADLYQNYYTAYRSQTTGQRFPAPIDMLMKFWRYLRAFRMKRLVAKKGAVLDVGCGQAIELQILRKWGVPVYGLEFSQAYARSITKSTKIPMYWGNLTKLTRLRRKFLLISFLHSLEHIPNALTYLKICRKLILPKGYLLISVPNFSSWERRLFLGNWFHLDIPRHLFHFSEDWLVRYLDSLGFALVHKKHIAPEYDLYSPWQSLLNTYFGDRNFFYKILLKEEEKTSRDFVELVKKFPFIVLCFILAIPLSIFFWIIGENGTIELVFQKK